MVYAKDSNGGLTFIDCTDRVLTRPFNVLNETTSTYESDRVEAGEIANNVVMCCRHPAAWGKQNMAGVTQIDYQIMKYQDGNSNNAIPVKVNPMGEMVATEVKSGLYYVYKNQIGTALTTGTVGEWNATNFKILYK